MRLTVQEVFMYVNKAKRILDSFSDSVARDKLLLVTNLITVDMLPKSILERAERI